MASFYKHNSLSGKSEVSALLLLNWKQKLTKTEKTCSLPVSLRRSLQGSGRGEGSIDFLGLLRILKSFSHVHCGPEVEMEGVF